MLHIPPTNCLLLTTKQEPYKKAYLLTKNTEEFFWKKFRRKGQQAENDKTERVTGLGRRTREEIAKWNQMTALRFQTGGRHQTSPASLRGFRVRSSSHRHICYASMFLLIRKLFPKMPAVRWQRGCRSSSIFALTLLTLY